MKGTLLGSPPVTLRSRAAPPLVDHATFVRLCRARDLLADQFAEAVRLEEAAALRSLVEKGALGAGVFETADCRKTYEELSAKGVEFVQPPTERFYGIESIVEDPFGNWFSVTEHK